MEFFLPTILGLALLLLILALKPNKWVARAAMVFAGVCALIGVGLVIDSRESAKRWADFEACRNTKTHAECENLLGVGISVSIPPAQAAVTDQKAK